MSRQPKAGHLNNDDDPSWGVMNALTVGVVLVFFVLWCQRSKGDDAAYWRARANAAIAINANVTKTGGTDAAPSPVETAKPPESSNLPEMTMFSVPGCIPCQRAEKDDKDGKFKGLFTLKKWDVTVREAPIEASLFPVFYWRGGDGRMWRYPAENPPEDTVHYPGHAELIRIWKDTQDKSKGQAMTQQLTPAQQALYQQARRAGYSDSQIIQYARKRGYIK